MAKDPIKKVNVPKPKVSKRRTSVGIIGLFGTIMAIDLLFDPGDDDYQIQGNNWGLINPTYYSATYHSPRGPYLARTSDYTDRKVTTLIAMEESMQPQVIQSQSSARWDYWILSIGNKPCPEDANEIEDCPGSINYKIDEVTTRLFNDAEENRFADFEDPPKPLYWDWKDIPGSLSNIGNILWYPIDGQDIQILGSWYWFDGKSIDDPSLIKELRVAYDMTEKARTQIIGELRTPYSWWNIFPEFKTLKKVRRKVDKLERMLEDSETPPEEPEKEE